MGIKWPADFKNKFFDNIDNISENTLLKEIKDRYGINAAEVQIKIKIRGS